MCGIFGFKAKGSIKSKLAMEYASYLLRLSESRGKDASGVAIVTSDQVLVHRSKHKGSKFASSAVFRKLFNEVSDVSSFIGQTRLATNGDPGDLYNNQPVVGDGGVVVHNGIVLNDRHLWREVLKKDRPQKQLDTYIIPYVIGCFLKNGLSLTESFQRLYKLILGAASVAYLSAKNGDLILATNTGSLYYVSSEKGTFFASEETFVMSFCERFGIKPNIKKLNPGFGLKIPFSGSEGIIFSLKKKSNIGNSINSIDLQIHFRYEDKSRSDLPETPLSDLKRHVFDAKNILDLKRCKRCILPETMPFIDFDRHGVCGYCRNSQKIEYKGKAKLISDLKKYKRRSGRANCILAFSGGRDSSYGLHYIKNELGLNPICYTYDWGMVSDIARRNQYLLTSKLGVEHVIISADITKKREYIRNNILAWLKKPDLGMVPLFMEGDKQNEYYINRLAQRTGIDLIIYCRGNELENEEFKWGYCGIKDGSPGGVIHNLSLLGKVQLLKYWGMNYLTNPSYINSSIFDTMFGYFSTYVEKHDYLYLWHYIPWNENKIVSTLINKYGWETNPETKATWRIDDATPAFYNYIFYAFSGFTENDTFRSNQIRQGQISREKALEVVNYENLPRYNSLKWYFDAVGLNGDMVLSRIDKLSRFSHTI